MVCHDRRRRRRRQAAVQLAPLHSWHRRVRRDRRDHRCRSHLHRHSHTRLSWYYSRCHQSGERKRREQRRRGGLQGRQRRERRGRLVSNAVTHPIPVLATGVADLFESRRCPAYPGHVALSPAPFTVGHRAVGRGRRFLLGPPSGVGTAVEWPPETKNRRQRFWRRTGVLLLLLAVDVMVAYTARPGLLYSASTSTRSTTASPRSSIPSTAGLEPSTSNKRVWVRRHPRCRPLFELMHLAGGPGCADNMLHVSAPKKRRV